MIKYCILLFSLLIVSGCQHHVKDENSEFYQLPVGSLIELKQALTIPTGRARAFIQYGEIIDKTEADLYYPHCEFEINTLKNQPQIIHPDTFVVSKVNHNIQWSHAQVMFASLSMKDIGDTTLVAYTNEYYLESEKQPDVLRLSCLHWEEHSNAYHLSINKVREALGSLFEIKTE